MSTRNIIAVVISVIIIVLGVGVGIYAALGYPEELQVTDSAYKAQSWKLFCIIFI